MVLEKGPPTTSRSDIDDEESAKRSSKKIAETGADVIVTQNDQQKKQIADGEPNGDGDGSKSHREKKVEGKEASERSQVAQPKLHSIFTRRERQFIVAITSLAAFFSPVSSSIYFPALNTLSVVLGVSVSLINLTVTTYLVRHFLSSFSSDPF